MTPNKLIIEFLTSIGITDVGFCNMEPLISYADFILKEHKDNAIYFDTGYNQSKEDDKWFNPSTVMKKGKTIITVILPYHLGKIKDNPTSARLSKATIFEDYHRLIGNKLTLLCQYIQTQFDLDAIAFCDFGPLNDKAVLLKTGSVKIGRNSLLIHPKYGSRFYIGYVITELVCDTSQSIEVTRENYAEFFHPFCSGCGKCKGACPNKAIEVFGHLSSSKCISFLTQSKLWTVEDAKKHPNDYGLCGYIYGCDICQQVCPLNGIDISKQYDYPKLVDENVDKERLLSMSKSQFNESYGRTSAGWIGKKRFLRNIERNEIADIKKQ